MRAEDALLERFTPTGVGTMRAVFTSFSVGAVHPHGRGDNYTLTQTNVLTLGSPPRAWGQFKKRANSKLGIRFTPTGVGTMGFLVAQRCHNTVHPHGRGDNEHAESAARAGDGSPPRAWGQLHAIPRRDRATRFTPTGVGTMYS